MKNYLGVCILKITRPNGERSEILVSNRDSNPLARVTLALGLPYLLVNRP